MKGLRLYGRAHSLYPATCENPAEVVTGQNSFNVSAPSIGHSAGSEAPQPSQLSLEDSNKGAIALAVPKSAKLFVRPCFKQGAM